MSTTNNTNTDSEQAASQGLDLRQAPTRRVRRGESATAQTQELTDTAGTALNTALPTTPMGGRQ
jgi:hypothetical protein